MRAWRGIDRFEGRAALRSWLYRIATNVCLSMLTASQRRARPMDLAPARTADTPLPAPIPQAAWIEPVPDGRVVADGDPAEVALARESIRLAFVAALQHLPPKQRAVLILREVLRWKADEVAELLDTTVASVNSALQRARSTLATTHEDDARPSEPADEEQRALLARYVDAFERYDMDSLTALLRHDATWNMPPYDLWLQTHEDIVAWCLGTGIGCKDSRLVPTVANGSPAFGQYKPSGEPGVLVGLVAPGARDLRRPDQRDHVLPRHRAVLPGVRAAPHPRGLSPPRTARPRPGHRSPAARAARSTRPTGAARHRPGARRGSPGPGRRSSTGRD